MRGMQQGGDVIVANIDKIYNSKDHYFPEGSLFCVKCGASASAARSQDCIRVQPSLVVA